MEDRLREIEERVAKASAGPWIIFGGWGPVKGTEFMGINRIGPRGDVYAGIVADHRYPPNADFYMTAENAEFVAASREDIPYLLNALRHMSDEYAGAESARQELEHALREARQKQEAAIRTASTFMLSWRELFREVLTERGIAADAIDAVVARAEEKAGEPLGGQP